MNETRIVNGVKYIRIHSVAHDPKIKVWIKQDSEDAKVITKKKGW